MGERLRTENIGTIFGTLLCGLSGGQTSFEILSDILNTPVSPELLPAAEGKISQLTENIIGPYELHDFFLYYFIRHGFSPKKSLGWQINAFKDTYSADEIQNGSKFLSNGFSIISSNDPVFPTDRKSVRFRFRREGIGACQAMPLLKYGSIRLTDKPEIFHS